MFLFNIMNIVIGSFARGNIARVIAPGESSATLNTLISGLSRSIFAAIVSDAHLELQNYRENLKTILRKNYKKS